MADGAIDYQLEIARKRADNERLKGQAARHELEIAEIRSRTKNAIRNIDACNLQIAENEKNIKALVKEHGEPPPLDLDKLRKELSDV